MSLGHLIKYSIKRLKIYEYRNPKQDPLQKEYTMIKSSNIPIMLGVLLGTLLIAYAIAEPKGNAKAAEEVALKFSEMTLRKSPGTEGSWIELYNRYDKKIQLSDYYLIIDGKKISPFKAEHYLPDKSLVVVEFSSASTQNTKSWQAQLKESGCAFVTAKPVFKSKKIVLGYCALYKIKPNNSAKIADYIKWGSRKDHSRLKEQFPSYTSHTLAVTEKIWGKWSGFNIGIDIRPGERGLPYGAVVSQLYFDNDFHGIKNWCVRTDIESGCYNIASKGVKNPIGQIWNGWYGYGGTTTRQGGIGFHPRPPISEIHMFERFVEERKQSIKGKLSYEVCIARDPYFEVIRKNVTSDQLPIVVQTKGWPKEKYFVRIRYTVGSYKSKWTQTANFFVETSEEKKALSSNATLLEFY